MFNHNKMRRWLAVGLAIGAAGFPAVAQARIAAVETQPAPSQPAHVVSASPFGLPGSQAGFQWADAGIGAAGALMLIGVGSGAARARRRRFGALAG